MVFVFIRTTFYATDEKMQTTFYGIVRQPSQPFAFDFAATTAGYPPHQQLQVDAMPITRQVADQANLLVVEAPMPSATDATDRFFDAGATSPRAPGNLRKPRERCWREQIPGSYVQLYNFTPEQADVVRKIKDAFVADLSSSSKVDLAAILANPIYARLIGSFEEINQKFDGKLGQVVAEMRRSFNTAA
jgi:hypothetical protein